jgi:hypothetical protein
MDTQDKFEEKIIRHCRNKGGGGGTGHISEESFAAKDCYKIHLEACIEMLARIDPSTSARSLILEYQQQLNSIK